MLLAVDTSTRNVGIALYNGISVLGEMSWYSHNYHTVELAPSIQDLFTRCGVQPEQLTVLAALGPGSFTGLRSSGAGQSIAQGQKCRDRIPTLDFLAAAQPPSNLPLVAVLQAGRGVCSRWYQYQMNLATGDKSPRDHCLRPGCRITSPPCMRRIGCR